MSDFRDIVDTEGLDPDEEARLRRVHDLLVQAGPPPDLPPALERTPEAAEAEIVQFPLLPRRRWVAAALVAATVTILAFGGGYLLGHSNGGPSAFSVNHVVPMHGSGHAQQAQALIRIASRDEVGNWPMELQVTGLPKQSKRVAYYELWLTKGHKPVEPCGAFRVNGDTTKVRFTIPYDGASADGWVVTEQPNGTAAPGAVVLTT
jgi:hypothetical protein